MALKITEQCINCDVCEPVCPNQAIFDGGLHYEIDAQRCTECVGHFATPQCVAVCPVDCIPKDPDHDEDHATLLARFRALTAPHPAAELIP